MAFHRRDDAPYYVPGGATVLPGHDKINDPTDPSVGGSGVAAGADGLKSGGVNDGTYFVAFGEDATSADANRPHDALAENTDELDNILHESLPLVTSTSTTAVGTVASFQITGDIFVGASGAANTARQRQSLVHILDANDDELEVGGTRVLPTLIHDGASVNVVGTVADGFYTNPTVNVSPSIPDGTTYRVFYGVRSTYDDMSRVNKGWLAEPVIFNQGRITAEVRAVLRDLHAASGQNWDDPWDATIEALAAAGLDERYRRATGVPGSFNYDTPGDGSRIVRDGPAVIIEIPDIVNTAPLTTAHPDRLGSLLRADPAEAPSSGGWPNNTKGGDIFLFQEVDLNVTADTANEITRNRVTGPLLLEAAPRDIRASTLNGDNVITKIDSTLVATANPDSGATIFARKTIQVNASDFVRNGSGYSTLRKTDIFEIIDDATSTSLGLFRLDAHSSATRFTVQTLSGGDPDFGAAALSVRLRWMQPTLIVGGSHKNATSGFYGNYQFMVIQPSILVDDYTDNDIDPAALFLSAMYRRQFASPETSEDLFTSLAWGGFDEFGFFTISGRLIGDGGIHTQLGRQRMNLHNVNVHSAFVNNTGGTKTISIKGTNAGGGGVINVMASSGPWTADTTFNFQYETSPHTYTPFDGDHLTIFIHIPTGTTGDLAVTWPGDFVFNGDDGEIPLNNLSGSAITLKYEGVYIDDGGVGAPAGFFFTRTVTTSSSAQSIFNVRDYGASGNGVGNDGPAIRNAVAACLAAGGGIVFFPQGAYLVNDGLTISWPGQVSFMGVGMNASEVRRSHATADLFAVSGPSNRRFMMNMSVTDSGVANTGSMFLDSGGGTTVDFTGCRLGSANTAPGSNDGIYDAENTADVEVLLDRCDIQLASTVGSVVRGTAGSGNHKLTLINSKVRTTANTGTPLFRFKHMIALGNHFDLDSVLGALGVFETDETTTEASLVATGNRFESTGSTTLQLFTTNGGGSGRRLAVGPNQFADGMKIGSNPGAGVGSQTPNEWFLPQREHAYFLNASPGSAVTADFFNYSVYTVRITAATNPTVSAPFVAGGKATLHISNQSGSQRTVSFSAQFSVGWDGVIDTGTQLAIDFVCIDNNGAGDYRWVQAGDVTEF